MEADGVVKRTFHCWLKIEDGRLHPSERGVLAGVSKQFKLEVTALEGLPLVEFKQEVEVVGSLAPPGRKQRVRILAAPVFG